MIACAEAEDQAADFDSSPDDGGSAGSGGASGGSSAGKTATGGSTAQGGKAGAGGKTSKGGTGGAGGTGNHAGTATAGGTAGSSTSDGGEPSTGNGGTNTGGTGSNVLGCIVEEAGGMPGAEGGAPSAGGAGEIGAGGAEPSLAGAPSGAAGAGTGPLLLFSDDFESGSAAGWSTTRGTWAVIDDGSKAYEQSLLENKLQIAIASDTCFADQIIEARVKVSDYAGQSNSYVAALFGRVLGPETHYLLALGSDKKLILRKRINSTSTSATAIGTAAALTVTEGQWYDVRFEIVGTSLKGCVGDVCVTGSDSSIASGGIAVGTVNTAARFDDVRVTTP